MRLPFKILCGFLLLYCLPFPDARAQPQPQPQAQPQPTTKDNQLSDSAYSDALQLYHAYMTPEPALYRGNRYVDYSNRIQQGQPFFVSGDMRIGTLTYNGIIYDHVPMIYDLVLGIVVINDPMRVFKISLIMDLVDSFNIADHPFIRLRDSLNPSAPRNGYYERLYQREGGFTLLKKEKKTYIQNMVVSSDNIQNYINYSVAYYLKKGNTYYSINSKKALYAVLKDRKPDVKKFIRKNSLNWRQDKESLILKVVSWYDTLNH
jgi:hypothetical protein